MGFEPMTFTYLMDSPEGDARTTELSEGFLFFSFQSTESIPRRLRYIPGAPNFDAIWPEQNSTRKNIGLGIIGNTIEVNFQYNVITLKVILFRWFLANTSSMNVVVNIAPWDVDADPLAVNGFAVTL